LLWRHVEHRIFTGAQRILADNYGTLSPMSPEQLLARAPLRKPSSTAG
jgi:hypothetical protein